MLNDYTNKFLTGEVDTDVKALADSIPQPERGGSYLDPWTGREIFRVTDAEIQFPRYPRPSFGMIPYILHEPLNADNTFLSIHGIVPESGSGQAIVEAHPPFNFVTSLPSEWGMSSIYPRWSRTDPDVIYACSRKQIVWANVRTGDHGIVFDFLDYIGISGDPADNPHVSYFGWQDKGDCDLSGRYWPLVYYITDTRRRTRTRTEGMLIWDMENMAIADSIQWDDPHNMPPMSRAHYPSISPSGQFFWSGGTHQVCRLPGFTDIQATRTSGHCDVAQDLDGRDVIVYSDVYQGEKWLQMMDMDNKQIVNLAPSNPAVHICGNYRNWTVVSVYAPRMIIDRETMEITAINWSSRDEDGNRIPAWNDRLIYAVENTDRLDPPPMMVPLATTITERVSYGDSPMANVSKSGDIYFNQNWGVAQLRETYRPDDYDYSGDVYHIPAGWDEGLDPNTLQISYPSSVSNGERILPPPEPTVYQIPDLFGLTENECEQALRDAGLRPGGYAGKDPVEPQDYRCYMQIPPPGEHSALFEVVVDRYFRGPIYAMDGSDRVEVPNLIGMTIDDARIALEDMELMLYEGSAVRSTEVAEGLVATQTPRPGALLSMHNEVTIRLSSGIVNPPQDPVPVVTIQADPIEITVGESTTLTWSSNDADTCLISPLVGAVSVNGSVDVTPSETTTYTITATGTGGSSIDSILITVNPVAPTLEQRVTELEHAMQTHEHAHTHQVPEHEHSIIIK